MSFHDMFWGGVYPPGFKLTKYMDTVACPPPREIVMPMRQHIGAPCTPAVGPGDEVLMGMIVGTARGSVSANVHASVSGRVTSVGIMPHPSGNPVTAVVIENDFQDTPFAYDPIDASSLTPEKIVSIVREAGIVGMGGAGFPTHIKLSPPADKKIDTILINCAECEPYLSADYRTIIEKTEAVVLGVNFAAKALGASTVVFGVEDNKAEACEVLKLQIEKHGLGFTIQLLPEKYPQGSEKQLIYAILRREVPSGGLPSDIGVTVLNVSTAAAIANAVIESRPLYERIVTVAGAVKNPANLTVRIGTPVSDVIEFCGGLLENTKKLVIGGPMMGLAQHTLSVPVIKGTSGILALEDAGAGEEEPCLRCGRCVEACPMGLMPLSLERLGSTRRFVEAEKMNILDCVECGACSYNCPAGRHLTQWHRATKREIVKLRAAK